MSLNQSVRSAKIQDSFYARPGSMRNLAILVMSTNSKKPKAKYTSQVLKGCLLYL